MDRALPKDETASHGSESSLTRARFSSLDQRQPSCGGASSRLSKDTSVKQLPNLAIDGSEQEKLSRAAKMLTEEAKLRWGAGKVHVSGTDAMESLAVLVLGPDFCQLLGKDNVSALARQTTVFGVGISRGVAEEAAKQKAQDLVARGTGNAGFGATLCVTSELCPPIATVVGVGLGSAWLYAELGPNSAERNRALANLWSCTGRNRDNLGLAASAQRVAALSGKDLFNNAFDLSTCGAGFRGASPLAKELPPINLTRFSNTLKSNSAELIQKIASSICSPQKLKPAYAIATSGSGDSLPVLRQQARASQTRDSQAKDTQTRDSQAKDTQTRDTQTGESKATAITPQQLLRKSLLTDTLDPSQKKIVASALENEEMISGLSSLGKTQKSAFQQVLGKQMKELAKALATNDSTEIAKALKALSEFNRCLDVYKEGADIHPMKPGIHSFTLEELKNQFSYNEPRAAIFEKIAKLASHLKNAGCQKLYIGGSFITGKKVPGDFDACFEYNGADMRLLDPLLKNPLADKVARKAKFGGDVFMRGANRMNADHVREFQLGRDSNTKGIVVIDLRDAP